MSTESQAQADNSQLHAKYTPELIEAFLEFRQEELDEGAAESEVWYV